MNQYITGTIIKELREKNKLTQLELASKLNVSDKTISKWETGKGYPDIEMVEDLAKILNVSVIELFNGSTITNTNISANLLKTKFYVCPICGNVVSSIGETVVSCHGITLPPLESEECDELHDIKVEKIENQYYIHVDHEMTKKHYISFIALVSSDRVQIVKLYPESNAEAYFMINGARFVYAYCQKDGLFRKKI